MTRINLPYLMRQRDRQGRWVWYYRRRKGEPKVRLDGKPGSAGFLASYQAAAGGATASTKPASVPSSRPTWRSLCEAYMRSPEFSELAMSTRRQSDLVMQSMWIEPLVPGGADQIGGCPLEDFGRRHVRVLRDRKASAPDAANKRIKVISAVFRWAISADLVSGPNPASDMPTLKPKKPGGHHTWTVAEVERYCERHPVGTKARLALAVFLFTGARISDAARFGRPMVQDGLLCWTEAKNAARHPKQREIPILPELQAILAATPLTGTTTWLVTQYGRPFSVKGLGQWFRDRCDEAGLKHCSAHGLRKAGATIAAENGATDRQLMAIFGWETAKQVSTYTRAADRKRLAGDAMKLLVRKD